jgi:zinc transport system permease protein
MELFSYDFLQRAFIVAILISIMTPLVGNVIVLKRLSSVGDALSHNSLAGVAIGLYIGINPVAGAIIVSVIAAICIEILRKSFPLYSEIATNIVLSLGIGLTSVFSGLITTSANFNSFLFGSIVIVSDQEFRTVILLCIFVTIVSLKLYKELFYITFDEEGAEVSGVKVNMINFIFTVITAIVVAVSSRTVGALVISTLIVLPVACAMQLSISYKSNLIYSICFAIFFSIIGIIISYYYNLKPGGTIALVGVATLITILIIKLLLSKLRQNN